MGRVLGALRLLAGMSELVASLGNPRAGFAEGTDRRRDFLSLSLDFWLSPNLALNASYKVGRDAPAYLWGRNFSLGLSGRFN